MFDLHFQIEHHAGGDTWWQPLLSIIWQMMYRIKDWFIHLLILSTVCEHGKQKTIVC